MTDLSSHSREFQESATELNVSYTVLSLEERQNLFEKIIIKHAISKKYTYPLWENISFSNSIMCQHGWLKLDKILVDEEVVFFFEHCDDNLMYSVKDSSVLPALLENCYRFVFYITNLQGDYVISYNDHDYYIFSYYAEKFYKNLIRS